MNEQTKERKKNEQANERTCQIAYNNNIVL